MSSTQPTASVTAESMSAVVVQRVPLAIVGDERIELSLKPSLWFVLLHRWRWLSVFLLGAIALEFAVQATPTLPGSIYFMKHGCYSALLLRAALTTLQWASRSYLLTNRRLMRIRGVMQADVAQCPLARVAGLDLHQNLVQSWLGVGTIRITPASDAARAIHWHHISKPAETWRLLREAVCRSRGSRV